jgi:hypothetical protein
MTPDSQTLLHLGVRSKPMTPLRWNYHGGALSGIFSEGPTRDAQIAQEVNERPRTYQGIPQRFEGSSKEGQKDHGRLPEHIKRAPCHSKWKSEGAPNGDTVPNMASHMDPRRFFNLPVWYQSFGSLVPLWYQSGSNLILIFYQYYMVPIWYQPGTNLVDLSLSQDLGSKFSADCL